MKRDFKLLLISATIFLILGIPFFFGFYFGTVKPENDKLNRTTKESCRIINFDEGKYNCSSRYSCYCGCSGLSSCSILESTIGNNGNCCSSNSCCSQEETEYYSCYDYFCSGCSGKKNCCWRTGMCSRKICVQYSTENCYVGWSYCWNIKIKYYILEREDDTRELLYNCGYNDYNCYENIYNNYMENSILSCWYDPELDSVSFSEPSKDKLNSGWVGTSFGILFLSLSFLSSFTIFFIKISPKIRSFIDSNRTNIENRL